MGFSLGPMTFLATVSCQASYCCSSRGSQLGKTSAYFSLGSLHSTRQHCASHPVDTKPPGGDRLLFLCPVIQACGVFSRRVSPSHSRGSQAYWPVVFAGTMRHHGPNTPKEVTRSRCWSLAGPWCLREASSPR